MAQPWLVASAKDRWASSTLSSRRVLTGLTAGAGICLPAPTQAAPPRIEAKLRILNRDNHGRCRDGPFAAGLCVGCCITAIQHDRGDGRGLSRGGAGREK